MKNTETKNRLFDRENVAIKNRSLAAENRAEKLRVFTIVALAIVALVLALFVGVPEQYIARFDVVTKTFTFFAVLVGLYVAARRIGAVEEQAAAATRSAKVAKDGQLTERYSRAVDQLGNNNPVVRLGGIYSLERIAWDSEYDHMTVMKVLCSLIRKNHARRMPYTEPPADEPPEAVDLELQAILDVLRRRKVEFESNQKFSIDLSCTDLRKANISDTQLIKASLRFTCLDRGCLSHTDLRGAKLAYTHFRYARLDNVDLQGTLVLGADLSNANLESAKLQETRLYCVNLRGVHLSIADLRNADLDDVDLRGANLQGADIRGIKLKKVNLEGANLLEVVYLPCIDLSGTKGDSTTILPEGLDRPSDWMDASQPQTNRSIMR